MNGFVFVVLIVSITDVSPIYIKRHLKSRTWCRQNEKEVYRRDVGFTCEPIQSGRPYRHISSETEHETTVASERIATNSMLSIFNIPAIDTPINPCDEFTPPVPDFREPGRRISQAKCMEYKWVDRIRTAKRRRSLYCMSMKYWKEGKTFEFTIGGRLSKHGEFPHMGAIGWKGRFKKYVFNCGTTLISSKFTLTAAHCSMSKRDTNLAEPFPKIVRLGKTYLGGYAARNDIKIYRFIQHPFFKANFKYYDIALIELTRRVKFSETLHPACLWSDMDVTPLGPKVTVTGWGATAQDGGGTSDLQAAELTMLDKDLCNQLLRKKCNRHWCGVRPHQICAGNLTGGVDSCHGDSGGPLQVKLSNKSEYGPPAEGPVYYVLGVTSFGIGCARVKTPGIYTRVAPFIDWIEQIVWNETEVLTWSETQYPYMV